MTGTILNVQRFSTEDGPGIRTTVFLKGCPLSCLWCHNPESQRTRPELLYDPERCVHCLKCLPRCPYGCHTLTDGQHRFDRTHCIACGACISPLCGALELSGQRMTVQELLSEVRKDRIFYEHSGGGVTLSGGEPLAHPQFTEEFLRECKAEGLHTAIETCGHASTEVLRRIASYVDLFLFDCKETDPALHKKYTGVAPDEILSSLALLHALEKDVILRCPIIPSLNDREDHFKGIAALANRFRSIRRIEIEPYHAFGEAKYRRLGRSYLLDGITPPDAKTVDLWVRTVQEYTDTEVRRA